MSWQCTSWALREAPAPTATARLVLIALADRCQPDGRSAWPTVDTLMLEAHTSESSVKRALKALEETGCIRRGNQKLAQWDEHGNYVPDPYRPGRNAPNGPNVTATAMPNRPEKRTDLEVSK